MNLTKLLTVLRYNLLEDTAAFWSDAELTEYLNDADLQVLIDIQGGDVYRDTTTVSGQASYDLPSYSLAVNRVTYGSDNTDLYRLSGRSNVLSGNSGTPTSYWIPRQANKVFLDPVPDTSSVTIRLHGRFKSDDMSSGTDVPESPDVLHMAIVYYAAMLAWTKRKDTEQARNAMALYQMKLANWDGPVDSAGPMRTDPSARYR